MIFQTTDETKETYIGETYSEVVDQMAARKFTIPASRSSYRRATAKRAGTMMNVHIKPETDESFVLSLVQAKLLEEIKDNRANLINFPSQAD